MDPDSSTGGLNDNSESGELDSLPGDGDYHFNNNSRDSLSKQSVNSERTNIDALDDTARDTIIVPPLDDSSSSASVQRLVTSSVMKAEDQELLDFDGDVDEQVKEEGEDDESDDGELIEHSSAEDRSPGELSSHSAEVGTTEGLEDGEVNEELSGKKLYKTSSNTRENEEITDELEEGEVSDDDDRRNKGPIPICRFFGKGQCTWGSNCRFLHPGVIDKGLYTMFEQVRPIPPPASNFPILKPGLLGHAPPNFPIPAVLKLEEPIVIESSWERAQRHAKELIKQSEKRKETDIDFEDKKLNLTLTQEEFDKENDYYVKKLTTPERDPPPEEEIAEIDEWDLPSSRRLANPAKIDPDFVRERVHHLKPGRVRQAPPRDSIREAPPLHEPEVRMVRESSFRRTSSRFHPAPEHSPPPTRPPRRGGSYENHPPHSHRERDRTKPDDWHDPWVRPHDRTKAKDSALSKRSSYSSGSSRSSSSSSRSSKSSKSSRSMSRSSKSSKESPRRRKPRDDIVRKAPPRRLSPKPMRIAPPLPPKEDFIDNRRSFGQSFNRPPRYAPPPPPRPSGGVKDRLGDKSEQAIIKKDRDTRGTKRSGDWDSRSASSRSRSRSRSWSRSKSPVPRAVVKKSKFSPERSRSKSSRKGSWSRSSSGSSSGASRHSLSKSRPPDDPVKKRKLVTPELPVPVKPIKVEGNDERRPKVKMESQSSQKIKMTMRPSSGIKMNKSILDKLADDVMGEDDDNYNPNSDNSRDMLGDDDSPSRNMKPSRREELLKQLQAVELAIAKKRSKIL